MTGAGRYAPEMRREIRVGRVYDAVGPDDGVRILVDRLWPRGLGKDAAALDEWAKDIAPSAGLRVWFGHDPAKFAAFGDRYRDELATREAKETLDRLRTLSEAGRITLLTATKDVVHSHASVLAGVLADRDEEPEPIGDPVCLLDRVCPECGLFSERRPPSACERCGAEIAG